MVVRSGQYVGMKIVLGVVSILWMATVPGLAAPSGTYSVKELEAAQSEAVEKGKGIAYLLTTARSNST